MKAVTAFRLDKYKDSPEARGSVERRATTASATDLLAGARGIPD